jgi:hypothetical protein
MTGMKIIALGSQRIRLSGRVLNQARADWCACRAMV